MLFCYDSVSVRAYRELAKARGEKFEGTPQRCIFGGQSREQGFFRTYLLFVSYYRMLDFVQCLLSAVVWTVQLLIVISPYATIAYESQGM